MTTETTRGRRNSYVKKYDADLRLDWQERAACQNLAPDFDYDQKPVSGKKTESEATRIYRPRKAPENVEEAQRVCVFDCPVREACLEFALSIEIPMGRQGIYGGLTPNERDALYNETRRVV